tara:strand:- start:414 stop:659 length:246 start_codon:yes stop_codon:yes gene_type:complete
MKVLRTIHWKEPVRKVRFFGSKAEVNQYKIELASRGLSLDDFEVEEIPLDYKYQMIRALNEAVGFGETLKGDSLLDLEYRP